MWIVKIALSRPYTFIVLALLILIAAPVVHDLEIEARQQRHATSSAQESFDLFNRRYEDGVDTYLQVITWQTALLQNRRNDIEIAQRRFEASSRWWLERISASAATLK